MNKYVRKLKETSEYSDSGWKRSNKLSRRRRTEKRSDKTLAATREHELALARVNSNTNPEKPSRQDSSSFYSRLGHIFLETAQLLPRSNRISGLPTRVTRRLKSGEPQRTRGEGTVTHNAAGSNPYVSSRDQKLEPNRRMRRHKKENG